MKLNFWQWVGIVFLLGAIVYYAVSKNMSKAGNPGGGASASDTSQRAEPATTIPSTTTATTRSAP